MREIKFRAWDNREKRMIYAEEAKNYKTVLAVGFHGLPIAVDSGSFRDEEIIGWNIDHYLTLMQYTGIKDKNGQEIYEGDIVRVENAENRTVAYGPASFHLVSQSTGSRILLEDRSPELLAVVGNIYEHQHLLPEDSDN